MIETEGIEGVYCCRAPLSVDVMSHVKAKKYIKHADWAASMGRLYACALSVLCELAEW